VAISEPGMVRYSSRNRVDAGTPVT